MTKHPAAPGLRYPEELRRPTVMMAGAKLRSCFGNAFGRDELLEHSKLCRRNRALAIARYIFVRSVNGSIRINTQNPAALLTVEDERDDLERRVCFAQFAA